MTTELAPPVPTTAAGQAPHRGGGAGLAVTRRAFRQVWVAATVWAVVFGGTAASSALAYVSSFPDQASRVEAAATTSRDTGMSILLGPVSSIDTVGGYTVYKGFVFLTTIGAVWGLLAATRLLRGEEDAGRWQLALAGATRPAGAILATAAALAGAVGVVFAGTTLILLLAGRDPDLGFGVGSTVVYGASIALAPLVFMAVGAVTSQLGRTRRVASELGMATFGVAFVLRMIADSGPGTKWLLWLTPFGWIERMRPFTGDDLRPLALGAVAVTALVATAAALAARRDAGAGVLAARDAAPPRHRGLGSPFGLSVRLESGVLAGWWAMAVAAALAFGIIAKITTGGLPTSLGNALDKFGVQGDIARQYFGVAFLMLATIVALLPASPLGAAADDETSGRLVHVLAQPTRRTALLAGRLVLSALAVVTAALLAGAATWLGARSQGVHAGFGRLVLAGLNVVPPALVVLGIGAVALAVAPRATTPVVYGVVVWSLLVDLLASLVDGLGWLAHVSLFHYMALAPAEDPDPVTVVVMLAVAAGLGAAATVLFARRDVRAG